MVIAAAMFLVAQSTPPAPTALEALAADSTHVVVISVRKVHDIRSEPRGFAATEIIEADVSQVLKGKLLGSTVFFPLNLWWRPDTTSIHVRDRAVVFLSDGAPLPYSKYEQAGINRLRGKTPVMAGTLGSWGYFPILGNRAVAAGGIVLPIPHTLWSAGDERGPSVMDLARLVATVRELTPGEK